jgi:hypothetical protein
MSIPMRCWLVAAATVAFCLALPAVGRAQLAELEIAASITEERPRIAVPQLRLFQWLAMSTPALEAAFRVEDDVEREDEDGERPKRRWPRFIVRVSDLGDRMPFAILPAVTRSQQVLLVVGRF